VRSDDAGACRTPRQAWALAEVLVAVGDTVTQVNSIAAAAKEMASSSRCVVEATEGVSAVVGKTPPLRRRWQFRLRR
jgi:hypothetical protein